MGNLKHVRPVCGEWAKVTQSMAIDAIIGSQCHSDAFGPLSAVKILKEEYSWKC
jgi:hypothetical protein